MSKVCISEAFSVDAIYRVRRKQSQNRRVQTSKLMHEWLLVNKMKGHVTGITQCPGYPHLSEDIRHLLRCPNPLMMETRKKCKAAIRQRLISRRVPHHIIDAVMGIVESQCGKVAEYTKPTNCPDTARAVDQQERIGFNMMMQGLIARGWSDALRATGSKRVASQALAMIRALVDDFLDPVWKKRCDILHREENRCNEAENKMLASRMLWCKRHKTVVMARQDWFLTEYDEGKVRQTGMRQKRRWVKLLDQVKGLHEKEKESRPRGQPAITTFFRIREEVEKEKNVEGASAVRAASGDPARHPRKAASPQGDAVS